MFGECICIMYVVYLWSTTYCIFLTILYLLARSTFSLSDRQVYRRVLGRYTIIEWWWGLPSYKWGKGWGLGWLRVVYFPYRIRKLYFLYLWSFEYTHCCSRTSILIYLLTCSTFKLCKHAFLLVHNVLY